MDEVELRHKPNNIHKLVPVVVKFVLLVTVIFHVQPY